MTEEEPWYSMAALKANPHILDIDDTFSEWITAHVDPKFMDQDGLYCFVCDNWGWYDNQWNDVLDGVLYGTTLDGTCRGPDWEDLHSNRKVQYFKVEDHQIIPLSKLDLVQKASKRKQKGLFARIRTLLSSKAGKEGNDGYRMAGPYFLDPSFVPVWDGYMSCPMCQEPVDQEFFAEVENSLSDPGHYNQVFYRLYKQGIHYENNTGEKTHLVELYQHCPIEDMNRDTISKIELVGGRDNNVSFEKKKTGHK